MLMIFMEILQLDRLAVPELPPSRNPLHHCTYSMRVQSFYGLNNYNAVGDITALIHIVLYATHQWWI